MAFSISINLLTLFALVLAIGIVVDDAIVIVEGATQHIEKGESPKNASINAMKELMGPVIGITLVLMAVFVPAGFMPGLTGAMYAQFALVIAATAFISAINAMTLKPTQCALWLKPIDPNKKKNILYRAFDKIYFPIEAGYLKFIDKLIHHNKIASFIGICLVALAIFLLDQIPTAFIPIEDQGYLIMNVNLPDGSSLGRTENLIKTISEQIVKIDGIENVIAINGVSVLDNNANLANAGVLYVMFKDWSVRGKNEDLPALYKKLNELAANTLNAKILVMIPPPIQGLGNAGGFQMQIELEDGSFDYRKLQAATDLLVLYGSEEPSLNHLMTSFRASVPQVFAPVDRVKAKSLGVAVEDAMDALETYVGSSYVNLFTKFGQVFQVYIQGDSNARMTENDLRHLHVKNESGEMVPIGTLTNISPATGPAIISLYNLYPSSNIYGVSAPGYSSGQSLQSMEQLASQVLPAGMSYEWTGTAYQEKIAGKLSYLIFALSLLFVYLILAGQYENWITPAAILLSVPLALFGTVMVLSSLGLANNIYTQIGILLLIALSAKNAILIVEVAREEHEIHGKSIMESALAGAKTRFRPIIMTSFAFILGVMPLVFATGAGASARRSIGIAVSSGMLASTCLAVVFVPAFYVILQTWQNRKKLNNDLNQPTPPS